MKPTNTKTSALQSTNAYRAVRKIMLERRLKTPPIWTISSDSTGFINDGAVISIEIKMENAQGVVASLSSSLALDGAMDEESLLTRVTEDAVANFVGSSSERFLRKLALELEKLKPKELLQQTDV